MRPDGRSSGAVGTPRYRLISPVKIVCANWTICRLFYHWWLLFITNLILIFLFFVTEQQEPPSACTGSRYCYDNKVADINLLMEL